MIDLRNERTLSLAEAAGKFPSYRRGRPLTVSCVLRWILTGTKTPSGEVVKLEAFRMGRRWLTTLESLQRFADAQTPNLESKHNGAPRPPGSRRRASERAEKRLEK